MSEYIHFKSEDHKVKHGFSGDRHFFTVETPEGETHNVDIQVGCDCRFMGVYGIPNSKMCSHILAVLKYIVKHAEINFNQCEVEK